MVAEYSLCVSVTLPGITRGTMVFATGRRNVDHLNGRNLIYRQCIPQAWFVARGESAFPGVNA